MESKFHPDVPDPADQPRGRRVISNFWTRVVALCVDLSLIAALGNSLKSGGFQIERNGETWFLFGPFWSVGGWGRLLEFCVGLVYFGVLNSSIAGGQTIGKRIMKIQVIDRSGHCISLGRSSVRSAVLLAPFFLDGVVIPAGLTMHSMAGSVGSLRWVLVPPFIYLYIANLRTRQNLHDLIVGTFVAQTTPPGQVVGSIRRVHLVVVGVWLVVASVATLVGVVLAVLGI